MDYQDAIAAGLGVTEYDAGGRAAQEIKTLWNWSRAQFASGKSEPKEPRTKPKANALPSSAKPPGRRLTLPTNQPNGFKNW